jgi:DNA-binding MarR family transcriptional regulator
MVRASAGAASRRSSESPRWLTSRELATWIEVRRLLQLLPSALDARTLRQTGVSFFEYQIMATLSESDDRARRMSELAEVTSSSLSRLSHAITRLEAKGFVVRRRCDGVGRSSAARLTHKGLRKLVSAAPDHVESVRALVIDALTEEQLTALRAIATRIVERLDDDDV